MFYTLYFKKRSNYYFKNNYTKRDFNTDIFNFILARDATFTGLGQGHGVSEYSKIICFPFH